MLKLLFAPTSPFVRKVMVCAHLTGQAGNIQLLDSAAHPVRRDARIAVHNPLAKVPTLILQDGQALYDSRVICEYLSSQADAGTIFPASGADRWKALSRQALGDGLLDAALLARYELTARPPEFQWPTWREALLTKVTACLASIEAIASDLAHDKPTIGEITIGCALGYLDFRYANEPWRPGHPKLEAWYAKVVKLPPLAETMPVG